MARNRGLRACPGNPRLPAVTHPAAAGENQEPDLLLPGLPAARPALR